MAATAMGAAERGGTGRETGARCFVYFVLGVSAGEARWFFR
jgi:hypothetical protein